ncbi:hypothetical protein [Ktedonobacter robiniae]|uniref:Cardiolipin synthase N-terminal domain-containing protein n=1 Tax=Ktedonobacter robiniae TaxID=2778365 RepID=A0ABQ3UJP0_9CHLR|nr:hypothetical protein [Ktedonobacter robiniae]GHO52890.1 hypothetical protein KSB_13650 [Ktedonobacter robiniae]
MNIISAVLVIGLLLCGLVIWRVRQRVWAIGIVFLWGVVPLVMLSFVCWVGQK